MVGSSGRIAAQALKQAGYTVDVFDCFGDMDTRLAARYVGLVPDTKEAPFLPAHSALIPLVQDWKALNPSGLVVTTTGFESSPDTLDKLNLLGGILGNQAQCVTCCKDPVVFYRRCLQLGLSTPALLPPFSHLRDRQSNADNSDEATDTTSCNSPSRNSPSRKAIPQWLKKTMGASGGAHIEVVSFDEAIQLKAPFYAQQYVEGIALSALFLNGPECVVLSIHRQYLAPSSERPFRFGGLVVDADIPEPACISLANACHSICRQFGLVGLNGLDAIWDGATLWLLEINPRPPASLALYPNALLAPLFEAHLISCLRAAKPTPLLPNFNTIIGLDALNSAHFHANRNTLWPASHNLLNRGMAIVYASALLSIPADFQFPSGCHDLPILPRTFQAGEPICSIVISDGGLGKLRAQVKALRECLNPVAGEDLLYYL